MRADIFGVSFSIPAQARKYQIGKKQNVKECNVHRIAEVIYYVENQWLPENKMRNHTRGN